MRTRTALLVSLLLLSAATIFALDFGAVLDNTTSDGNQQDPAFGQKDKLSFWFNSGLGKNLTFDTSLSLTLSNAKTSSLVFNPDLLNLSGDFTDIPGGPAVFSFTLGRYNESDFTGFVFSGQSLDGFTLGFTYPGFILTADLGYTGLTLNPDSTIFMTQADLANQQSSSEMFGSPRILGRLQALMPALFLRQDLTLSVLFQQDLRSVVGHANLIDPGATTLVNGEGGSLDSEYIGAGVSGSAMASLFYKTYVYVETGRTLAYAGGAYKYEPILAFLAGGQARYYAESLLHSTFEFDVLFASGDKSYAQPVEGDASSGYASAFIPITSASQLLSLAYSPNVENIVATTFSYSIRPFADPGNAEALQNLQATVKATPFLRPTTGAVAASAGLASDAVSADLSSSLSNLYLGSEIDLIVNYRPFSDLGVSLQGGFFVPNSKVFVSSDLLYYVGLQFSMSF